VKTIYRHDAAYAPGSTRRGVAALQRAGVDLSSKPWVKVESDDDGRFAVAAEGCVEGDLVGEKSEPVRVGE